MKCFPCFCSHEKRVSKKIKSGSSKHLMPAAAQTHREASKHESRHDLRPEFTLSVVSFKGYPSSWGNPSGLAEPRFKEPSRFPELADPLLQGEFPQKGLNQAVAVAAMCLIDDASIRPLISDVVTALSFLGDGPGSGMPSPKSEITMPNAIDNQSSDIETKEQEMAIAEAKEREIAIAEAKEWGSRNLQITPQEEMVQ